MNVNNFLLSQKSPCQDAETFGSAITGTLTGHNGKTSPVNAGLQLKCKGIYGTSIYKKSKKTPTYSTDASRPVTGSPDSSPRSCSSASS